MSLSNKNIELIEKYLDEELSPQEESLFDAEIASSEEFAQYVEIQQSVLAGLKAKHRQSLKEDISNIYQNAKAEKRSRKSYSFIKIAATVCLLTVSFIVIKNFVSSSSPKNLFKEYYQPYPAEVVVRGSGPKMSNAMTLYEEGDYIEAASLLKTVNADNDNTKAQLYLGNCYLQLGESEMAIETFQSVIEADDQIFKAHGKWYQALSYLQAENKTSALIYLNDLIENRSIYQDKAQELKEKIVP